MFQSKTKFVFPFSYVKELAFVFLEALPALYLSIDWEDHVVLVMAMHGGVAKILPHLLVFHLPSSLWPLHSWSISFLLSSFLIFLPLILLWVKHCSCLASSLLFHEKFAVFIWQKMWQFFVAPQLRPWGPNWFLSSCGVLVCVCQERPSDILTPFKYNKRVVREGLGNAFEKFLKLKSIIRKNTFLYFQINKLHLSTKLCLWFFY